MTPPAKGLPPSASQFPSIRYFREKVERSLHREAQNQGQPTPEFDWQKVRLEGTEEADGLYQLSYRSPELNLNLNGLVQTRTQQLSLWKEKPGQGLPQPIAYLEMEDTCSLSRAVGADADLKDGTCRDGVVEPKLVEAAGQFPTLMAFDEFCRNAYQDYLQQNPRLRKSGGFDLKRTSVLNPQPGNSAFDLFYENPANAFYCRGHSSTRGLQHFLMSSGSLTEFAQAPEARYVVEGAFTKKPQVHEMNDACRMTEALVGSEEIRGRCLEWSDSERIGVRALETLGSGIKWAFLGMVSYDAAGWLTKGIDWAFKSNLHGASFGRWGSPSAWLSRKIWAGVSRPFVRAVRLGTAALRWVPQWANGARLAFAGAETAGGSTVSIGSGLAGSFTGTLASLGSWGATSVGAAGAGSIALAAGAAFAGGFALGTGLEKAQQALFGNSLGGLLGDAAFKAFGPADSSTIDWVDKYLGWLP